MQRVANRGAAIGAVVIATMIVLFISVAVLPVNAVLSSAVITDVKPSVLHPGTTTEVTLTVRNNGVRDARDVRIEFKVSDRQNISVVGPAVVQIPSLSAWSEKKVKIKVHVDAGVHEGVYTIPATYSWNECYHDPNWGYVCLPNTYVYDPKAGMGFQVDKPVSEITFIVKGKPDLGIGKVYTDPAYIRAGDEDVKLTAVIWNTGDADAKDVEVHLGCNDNFKASWSASDRAYIARLDTGKGFSAVFHIDVLNGAKPDTYLLPLVISYKDMSDNVHKEDMTIKLTVMGKPKLELVSYATEPADINAGDHVRLHLKIANRGSEDAESVYIQPEKSDFEFDQERVFIGAIKRNEAREAILGFTVNGTIPPGIYQQALSLNCRSRDNETFSFEVYIPLEVSLELQNASVSNTTNRPEYTPGSVPGFYVILALIAFLCASLIMRVRRNR